MSGTALGWVKRVQAPCAQTRNLLRVLADYADDDGFAWPSLRTMAGEMQMSERMVKRHLRSLEAARVLVGFDVMDRATGRTRTSAYWFPIFGDTPNERLLEAYERKVGGRMKRHPIEAESAAEIAGEHGGEGVMGDTLEGGADVPREGVVDDPGRVSPMTPLEPLTDPAGPNGPTQRARALEASPFDRVFSAWAVVAPGRLSRPRSVGPWVEACALVDEARLAGFALRYLAEDADVQRGRAMSLDRWLAEKRWEPWMVAPPVAAQLVAAARTPFAGPPEIRARLVAKFGEGKAVSYLDPSDWIEAGRIIEAKTGAAEGWLRGRDVAAVLEALNVKVERARA